MLKTKCKTRMCALISAWLWGTGLILMGKITHTLESDSPSLELQLGRVDLIGLLQIFFLFYTVTCVAVYFLWTHLMHLKEEIKSLKLQA